MKLGKIAVILLGLIALAMAPLANASVKLAITDGVTTANVSCDVTGVCVFNGALGDWVVNVVTGIAAPPGPLGPPLPHLDVSFSDVYVNSGTGKPATIYLLFTDDTLGIVPLPGLNMKFGGTNTNMSSSYSAFFDTGNVDFGRTVSAPSTVPGGLSATASLINTLSFGNGAYSGTTAGPGPGSTSPYSLTEMIVLTATSATANGSGNAELQAVPEPAGILLLGGMILGLSRVFQKKMGRSVSQA